MKSAVYAAILMMGFNCGCGAARPLISKNCSWWQRMQLDLRNYTFTKQVTADYLNRAIASEENEYLKNELISLKASLMINDEIWLYVQNTPDCPWWGILILRNCTIAFKVPIHPYADVSMGASKSEAFVKNVHGV